MDLSEDEDQVRCARRRHKALEGLVDSLFLLTRV